MLHRIGMFNHVRGWEMLQLLAERSHDTVLGFLKSELASWSSKTLKADLLQATY